MTDYSYGISRVQTSTDGEDLKHLELRHQGYCVIPHVLSTADLALAGGKLEAVYARQESEFGREMLRHIQDVDTVRLPLAYDAWFLTLAAHPAVLLTVRQLIGDYVLLHLQNGIINRPGRPHRQSAWHRDLPYQEWISSKPLALSALFCLDHFTSETGGTWVLPHSHCWAQLPPNQYVEKHAIAVTAEAGSVILFDSMLFHRAGTNTSNQVRRGINHVYTIPILKQQIDLPRALGQPWSGTAELAQLLGYTSQSAESVSAWRKNRMERHPI